MDSRGLKYIGKSYPVCDGYIATVIDYINKEKVKIQLNDGTIMVRRMDIIKRGQVKNPNHKSVCGIGFTGEGEYVRSIDGKHTQVSRLWKGMLYRCYSPKYHKGKPTYKDCYVCEEWHNFQNFAKWHEENYYKIENSEMH